MAIVLPCVTHYAGAMDDFALGLYELTSDSEGREKYVWLDPAINPSAAFAMSASFRARISRAISEAPELRSLRPVRIVGPKPLQLGEVHQEG